MVVTRGWVGGGRTGERFFEDTSLQQLEKGILEVSCSNDYRQQRCYKHRTS